MPRYLIGLGSSHPAGIEYIQRACLMLDASPLIRVVASSVVYASPAMGGQTQFSFTNSALAITTSLLPDALWFFLRSVEHKLGRVRLYRNGPRTIDLDVLWCVDGHLATPFLDVPHPGFWVRPFALKPALQAAQRARWSMPPCRC